MVTILVTGERMKKILLLLAVISSFALGKESWELTLLMNRGEITLTESRVIPGAPKESRRRNSMNGPASPWGWQIVSAEGTVLKESRFLLPSHYCSSDEHLEIDSVETVITIPQVAGGAKVQIVEYSHGEASLSGAPEAALRSAVPVRAQFDLPGGVR